MRLSTFCGLRRDQEQFGYQAQSDITDHGYWTECPPMVVLHFRHYKDFGLFHVVHYVEIYGVGKRENSYIPQNAFVRN